MRSTTRLGYRALDIGCALFFSTALAWGDEPPAVDLGTVEVVSQSASEPVSASPTSRDKSASTTVIELDGRRTESKSVAELMAQAPGVVVHDTGGIGQTKTLSIRGASPNAVTVLFDGMPLQCAGASVDLSRFSQAFFSRLEVMRGLGARYQPGGLGGVVNLVSNEPEGTSGFAAVSQGSFESTLANLAASTPLLGGSALFMAHGLSTGGRFNYQFDELPDIATDSLQTRQRSNNQAVQGGALLKFKRYFGDTRVDLLVDAMAERRGLAGTVYNPTPQNTQSSTRGVVGVRVSHQWSSGQELSVLGTVRGESLLLLNSPFLAARFEQSEASATVEAQYLHPVSVHRFEALVTAGGDTLLASQNSAATQGRVGLMLADELSLFSNRLQVIPSARVDLTGPFVTVSPKVGALFELTRGLTLSANVGQASRPPSFLERLVRQGAVLPNADLKPERALQVDAAVAFTTSHARLSLGGFVGTTENLIAYELYPPMLVKPFNFATASMAGVEAEGQWTVRPWLRLKGAYTFLRAVNIRDTAGYFGKPLPLRPAHTIAASFSVGPEWLSARVDGVYTSAQFQNRGATIQVDGRTLLNLGLHSSIAQLPGLSFGAELKNALDVSTVDQSAYPLPPRSIFFTASLHLEKHKT